MKTTSFFTFLIFFILTFSCNEPELYPEDCSGYYAGAFKKGYSFAEGSYQDYGDYAIFVRESTLDTLTGNSRINTSLVFSNIGDYCEGKNRLFIQNLNIGTRDTIQIKYSNFELATDFPTAFFSVLHDYDALIETYHLLDVAENNWLLIESINSDSTEIIGSFSLNFVTTYQSEGYERWDDPNRPDTLHFTNGEFRAEFVDY